MYRSLIFWALLFLPGYALVRRLWPEELKGGLLAVLAISYLLTLGMLSPVSIAGYVLGLPLWDFSGAIAILVLGAVFDISRQGTWPELLGLLRGALTLGLVMIVFDLILGAREGAFVWGDAHLHRARIRFLMDYGLSNQDPFVTAKFFYPIYNTNILHALYASCAQTTGVDPIGVWYASLPWAKLLVVSGAYYLAWVGFERSLPAWCAAMFTLGAWGPITYVNYPNKLAPLWLLPCVLAFVIRVCQGDARWRSNWQVLIGSLVLAQMHALYAAVALLAAGPVLVVFLVIRTVRRQAAWRIVAVGLVALCIGLPFVFASRASARVSTDETVQEMDFGALEPEYLIQFDEDSVMLSPRLMAGPNSLLVLGLLSVSVLGSLFTSRRDELIVACAWVVTVAGFVFLPWLCTPLYAIVREDWILNRCAAPLRLAVALFVPGLVAYVISVRWNKSWVRPVLGVLWLLAGAMLLGRTGMPVFDGEEPVAGTWPSYVQSALEPSESRCADLVLFRETSAFLNEHIPAGATVLTPPRAMGIVALHNCFLVAPDKGSTGITDMVQRRADLRRMRSLDTPWPEKLELLKEYGITHVVAPDPRYPLLGWARRHAVDQVQSVRGTVIIELNLDE